MNSLLEIALDEFGTKETVGNLHNPEVVKYFINGGSISDETAWCSAFINYVGNKAGFQVTNNLTARSWLSIGIEVCEPKKGDIVIFWRGSVDSWMGHVGLFINERNGYTRVLGGNQNNEVNIKAYRTSKVLGYRRLIN